MKVKPSPPEQLVWLTIALPNQVWSQLDREATERRCTRNDLLAEVARRLSAESDFLDRIKLAKEKIIQLRQAGKSDVAEWPKDPLDCVAVALCMAIYLEQMAEQKILAMTPQELDYWSGETKRTGLSFEYLICQSVFSPAQEAG